MEFKASEQHKKAINYIYGKEVYPMDENKELTRDIDPKTGKITPEHMEECCGCALCEGDKE